VDAESGGITVRDASSWPAVNGLSYYASAGLNLGSPDALLLPDTQAAARVSGDDDAIIASAFAPGRFVVVDGEHMFDGTREEAEAILHGRVVRGDHDKPVAETEGVSPNALPSARDSDTSSVSARLPGLAAPLADHVPGCTTSTTYALLIQGADDSAMNRDMERIKEMFGRGGIPAALVSEAKPGAERPLDEIKAKWQRIKAQATRCDHVFIYITAHAANNGMAIIDTPRKYKDGTPVEWDGLAASDFDFGNCRACHITIIIDTCFSAKALTAFRARLEPLTGRKAFIMSATDANNEAMYFMRFDPTGATGGAFTTALVTSFNEQVEMSGGGNVSLGTVFDNANTSLAGSLRSSLRMMNSQWWERKLQPGETCVELVGTATTGAQPQTPTPSPTPVTDNSPPVVSPIQAVLGSDSITRYTVLVNDPDGDILTAVWEGRDCGPQAGTPWNETLEAQGEFEMGWQHTATNCHRDTFRTPEPHPVHANTVIKVTISDASSLTDAHLKKFHWQVVCTYTGVATGTGPACSAPVPAPK